MVTFRETTSAQAPIAACGVLGLIAPLLMDPHRDTSIEGRLSGTRYGESAERSAANRLRRELSGRIRRDLFATALTIFRGYIWLR
jgi:hypothetical protein